RYKVEWNGEQGYEIRSLLNRKGYTVHLANNHYSCRAWNLTLHAICAIQHKGGQVKAYIKSRYNKESYLKTYEGAYHFWPTTDHEPLLPTPVKVMHWRPKTLRRKHPFEEPRVGKLSRVGRVFTCSLCGETGHNKKANGNWGQR
ncbi:hypothetical protein CFOL_v3_15930, partial [Cephalotus follicularis]